MVGNSIYRNNYPEKTMIKYFQRTVFKPIVTFLMASPFALPTLVFAEKAYLEITLKVDPQDRAAAGAVYKKFKELFLTKVSGAKSKEL